MALPVGLVETPSQLSSQDALDAQLSQQLASEIATISPELTAEQSALFRQVEAELQEVCRAAEQAPGCTEAGQLHRLGALRFGVLCKDDVADFVYVAALRVPLQTMPSLVQHLLADRHPDLRITQALPVAPFASSGLRLTLRGVKVSLLFAQKLPGVPAHNADTPVPQLSAFHALEAEQKILATISGIEKFSKLLRYVRHWAKQRGVHGTMFGFFTGMAWALCCAWICQTNPALSLAKLTLAFFRSLVNWDWRTPVRLLQNGAHRKAPVAQSGTSVQGTWLLVQLPIGDSISATPFVSQSSLNTLQQELRRAVALAHPIVQRKRKWSDLHASHLFFQHHRHYVQLDFLASSADVMEDWFAWCRSHLQEFVVLFESVTDRGIEVRPWPKVADFSDPQWPHGKAVFLGLNLDDVKQRHDEDGNPATRLVDLREVTLKFTERISSWPEADQYSNQFDLLIRHVRLSEMKSWLELHREGRQFSHDSGGYQ